MVMTLKTEGNNFWWGMNKVKSKIMLVFKKIIHLQKQEKQKFKSSSNMADHLYNQTLHAYTNKGSHGMDNTPKISILKYP